MSKLSLSDHHVLRLSAILLAGGAIAWFAVLFLVLRAVVQDDSTADNEATAVPTALTVAEFVQLPTLTPTVASPTPQPTRTPMPSATPSVTPTATLTLTPTALSVAVQGPIPTPTTGGIIVMPPVTPEVTAAATCTIPAGWEPYEVQPGDTLFAFQLGMDSTVTVDDLIAANCLTNRYLYEGQMIFLPPGAAENAPSSDPVVEASGQTGPRTPNCPCTITVTAGWRREQIADAIDGAQTLFTGADFLNVTGSGASAPFDFVMSRPAGTTMEGFLFPGTYTVANDTTAEGFRDMLLGAFAANVSGQIQADAAAQGVTFYQALVIASIIQRESRAPETQKLIASVYYNRYRDNNRLAATVTIQYVLGRPGNWWPRLSASELETPSPYNTYIQAGLPPAPIDSPGLSAILAAVYPPQTEYYYHTASCNGTGEAFAATYEEHLQNVNCE